MAGITTLFGESPRMKVLEFFMQFPKHEFTVPELVEGIGMSRTTAFSQTESLLNDGMIITSRKVGKSPTYKINSKSPLFRVMQKMNSYRSKEAARTQLKRNNLKKFMIAQLNKDVLEIHKQLLENELTLTKTKLKKIAA